MFHPKKPFLSNIAILMLLLHPIAQAEPNATPLESNEKQIQMLQTQISDANGKITVLETALNTANQDIIALRNGEALKPDSGIQSDTANAVARRTANGHGR